MADTCSSVVSGIPSLMARSAEPCEVGMPRMRQSLPQPQGQLLDERLGGMTGPQPDNIAVGHELQRAAEQSHRAGSAGRQSSDEVPRGQDIAGALRWTGLDRRSSYQIWRRCDPLRHFEMTGCAESARLHTPTGRPSRQGGVQRFFGRGDIFQLPGGAAGR